MKQWRGRGNLYDGAGEWVIVCYCSALNASEERGRLAAAADPLILSHLGQVASWVGLHHDHDGGDLDDGGELDDGGNDGGDGGDGGDGDGDCAAGRQPLILNETAAATFNPCSVTNANTIRQRKANTSSRQKCIFWGSSWK